MIRKMKRIKLRRNRRVRRKERRNDLLILLLNAF
jgi:hypothetical protein